MTPGNLYFISRGKKYIINIKPDGKLVKEEMCIFNNHSKIGIWKPTNSMYGNGKTTK